MLTYLIVSGLCPLVLLQIVRKVWQRALEIHSAADNLGKARDLVTRGQQATNDRERNASATRWLGPSSPDYCDVG
jgi:hypothetical protein